MIRYYALLFRGVGPTAARTCLALLALVLLALLGAPAYATGCANAITINPASLPIVSQAITCGTGNDLNSTNVPGDICGTGDLDYYKNGNEALYKFTPTTTGSYQLTLEGQTWNAAMVYIGCPTANNCLYGDGTTGSTVSFTVTLNAGITYYLWFDTWPSPNSPCPGTFSLGPPPPPATNDDPCGAINLPVNASCTYSSGTTSGTTGTTGVPAPSCSYYNGGDVWYRVTVPATGALTVTTAEGVITDGGMALYTASSCNGPFTQIACNDDANGSLMPEIVASGLTPGSTVYIRFWEYGNDGPGSFSICATTFTPPPPPVCGGMFYDPGGASGNYANNTNYTVTICPIVPGDMVSLIFSMFNTEFIDGLSIYDGINTAAPLLGTFSGTTLPPLLMASNPSGCLTAQFISDVSVVRPGWAAQVLCSTLPAGDCVYVLRLHDSAGNGWGSSMVRVRINGGAWTNYTVTTFDNAALIGVNIGDLLEIDYVASGPNQGQNSYSISKLGQNPYFTSLTPPAPGISFIQTVTCGPPPALPQDCAGGITICNSQSITNNSGSTGDVMDLNASNQGCLSSGERQGTWYFFSPQTAGTIGFSIAPANGTDDYDFAVWGPFPNAQCPTGPPLRCSYNAPPSYTVGLGNGASDVTEGAGGDGWVSTIPVTAGSVYVLYVDNFSSTGQAFTLSWQLTGGSSLDCTTLPVELLSLEANPDEPVINVTWATATEHESHYFTVERSPDNETFTPIGTVAAAGNAQFRNDYLFVDQVPFRGVNYYRLEQVDIDGTTMRTHTVVATLSDGNGRPSIFPNPASDVLNVVFPHPLDAPAELQVQDALGRTVATARVAMDTGQRTAQVPIEKLAKGWYSLRIAGPEGQVVNGGGFLKR